MLIMHKNVNEIPLSLTATFLKQKVKRLAENYKIMHFIAGHLNRNEVQQ